MAKRTVYGSEGEQDPVESYETVMACGHKVVALFEGKCLLCERVDVCFRYPSDGVA